MEKVTAFMDSGVSYGFDLPNGKTLTICSYTLNTFTLKVVILFECKFVPQIPTKRTFWYSNVNTNFTDENMYSIYYDGHITDRKIFLNKPKLWDLIKSDRIDQLLLDTTSFHITEFNVTEIACKKIVEFLG